MFELNTKDHTKRIYRLLIFDRYNSYLPPRFDLFYAEYKIALICISPHSSYFLQPLNVSCFLNLKRSYNRQIEQFMRRNIDFINNSNFLISDNQACTETYQLGTICNRFKATELVLYDPIGVLLTL